MKREIKFRGKNEKGEWLYGSLIDCLCFRSILSIAITRDTPIDMLGCEIIRGKVKDKTIGQYTGLKDKNGREIYEGDILRSDRYPFSTPKAKDNLFAVVAWLETHGMFALSFSYNPEGAHRGLWDDKENHIIAYYDELEVIGNIHDNPELVEKSND